MIEVLHAGFRMTVQDMGRPGFAALGVARSGAMDPSALALGNRLVGNPPQAAGLEVVLNCRLRFTAAATVAVTGARPTVVNWGTPMSIAAGGELILTPPPIGFRYYVAVRGGIAVEPTLGSRSTDTLSGLGPSIVKDGDLLPVGSEPSWPVSAAQAIPSVLTTVPTLHVTPGPREDWFASDALKTLTDATWMVRSDSDRIGLRLDGPPLPRLRMGELPSEPTLPGALQIPTDGRPILFGPDAPVTGGYPVIAVVRESDQGRTAQLRPGDALRFRIP